MRAVCFFNGWICIKYPAAVIEASHHARTGFTLNLGSGKFEEHAFYWRKAAEIFPDRVPLFDKDNPESKHRNGIQYWDHIGLLNSFQPNISLARIQAAFKRLASLSPAQVPDFDGRPHLISLQTNALHRLLIFRNTLDQELAGTSPYWQARRNVGWIRKFVVYPEDESILENIQAKGSAILGE
jgi:hypothetical protein